MMNALVSPQTDPLTPVISIDGNNCIEPFASKCGGVASIKVICGGCIIRGRMAYITSGIVTID
jgi:hypothetical protein